jgi:LPS export ABC transporter protein LptC
MIMSNNQMPRPVLLLLVCLLALPLAACGEEGAIPASADVALPACDNEIDGLTQYLTSEGIRTAFLQADRGCLWQNSDTIVVEGFRLTVYQDETGIEQAVVTGERGVLNTVTERMRANGNAVLFIPAQGRRIESEELFYDPQANRMYSDSATTMYLEGRIVEGSGFESDLSFENPTIRQFRTRPGPAVPPGVPEPTAAPLPDPEGASGEPVQDPPPPVPDTSRDAATSGGGAP